VGESLLFAQDDVECLDFSPDFGRAVAGGFDGVLQFFDNTTPDLHIDRTLRGFSHQLSDVVWAPDGSMFVLTHDGNLARVDEHAREHARAPFRRQCVWDIQPSLEDEDTYYLATDDGAAVVTLDRDQPTGPAVRACRVVVSGCGFTRRLVPVERGWVAISRDSFVSRSTVDGEVVWRVPLPGLLHTLGCSPDRTRIMVAGSEGGFELDAHSGERIRTVKIDGGALWATTYLPTGEVMVATPTGLVYAIGADTDTPLWMVDFGDYPKRMWCHEKSLFVTGGSGVKEFYQDGSGLVQHWSESMSNTCDNAVVLGDRVFVISYDGQIGLFERHSGELIGVLENLPEIPKGLALVTDRAGDPYLLIGGRSGFVGTYRIDTAADTVVKVRDFVVARQPSAVAHPGLSVSTGTRQDSPA
jgi:WD40 repeat protein